MKLQNNFTTPEQSKRLLELGLPADSADMRYTRIKGNQDWHKPYMITTRCKFHGARCMEALPCWSVGRLIEILKLCVTNKSELEEIFIELQMCIDNTEILVQTFKEYSEVIDFSKLED